MVSPSSTRVLNLRGSLSAFASSAPLDAATKTSRPASTAAIALANVPAPEPMQTTSTTLSQCTSSGATLTSWYMIAASFTGGLPR